MTQIKLPNDGSADCECLGIKDLYYPRLMVNKRGEIVLATHKRGSLTTGIYVGQVEGTTPPNCVGGHPLPIGTKLSDWEVVGELHDYDGEVELVLSNKRAA